MSNLPPGEEFTPDFSHVTEETRLRRRLFVLEYIKDFHKGNAVLRMGFRNSYDNASALASQWLKEPYTQYLLEQILNEVKEESLITRNKVIVGLLKEANYHGFDSSAASRVSALGKLAKILGMEITKIELPKTMGNGVMLVPFGGTVEDWEKSAADAQAKLKLASSESVDS